MSPPARAQFGARGADVLPVLLAARIRVLRGGDESHRVPRAIHVHLVQRIRQKRMPVAHPDVDRQRVTGGREAIAKPVRLTPGQRGDRRHSAKQLVVVRHFLDALGRYAAAAQDVGEKGPDVVGPCGPPNEMSRTESNIDQSCQRSLRSSNRKSRIGNDQR